MVPWVLPVACTCVAIFVDSHAAKQTFGCLSLEGQAAALQVEHLEEIQVCARAAGSVWLAAGAMLALAARLRPACFSNAYGVFCTGLHRVSGRMTRFARGERTDCALLILLTLCTGAFTMVALAQPVRWDESTTYLSNVTRPWYFSTSVYTCNSHLPYSVLSHSSTTACESSPWAIRLPAALAGAAVVPLGLVALRRHVDPATALVAALHLAAPVSLIDFGGYARGATIATACTLCLLLSAPRRMQPRVWVWRALLVVFAALGPYTVLTIAYSLVMVGV